MTKTSLGFTRAVERFFARAVVSCVNSFKFSPRALSAFTLTIFESPIIHSVCPPNLHKLLFSHALGNMKSPQEHLKTTTDENLGVNRVYNGGFENREL